MVYKMIIKIKDGNDYGGDHSWKCPISLSFPSASTLSKYFVAKVLHHLFSCSVGTAQCSFFVVVILVFLVCLFFVSFFGSFLPALLKK